MNVEFFDILPDMLCVLIVDGDLPATIIGRGGGIFIVI
jgi:hypothetical protein